MSKSMSAALALLMLCTAACASLSNSQPVRVVCASCAVMQAMDLCPEAPALWGPALKTETVDRLPQAGTKALRVACETGKEPYVVNFRDVVERKAAPIVTCR